MKKEYVIGVIICVLIMLVTFAGGYTCGTREAAINFKSKVTVKEIIDKEPIDHSKDKTLFKNLQEIEANTKKALEGKK